MKIGKLVTNDSLPTFQVKSVLDEQYVDITDVYHCFRIEEIEKDFLFRRQMAIQFIIGAGGFDNLTDNDKAYAAKNYCVGSTDRTKIFSLEDQEEHWYHFVVSSEECRKGRWDKAKAFASFRLSIVDSNDLALSTDSLNQNYIKYGFETKDIDGQDGLLDWLEGNGSFSGGTGFSAKPYYTEEIKNGIIDKLNGL